MYLLGKDTCIALGLLDEGWPFSWLQVSKLSLQESAHRTVRTDPSDLPSRLAQLKEALVADMPDAFEDKPFRQMNGPAMHIEVCRQRQFRVSNTKSIQSRSTGRML